MDKQNANTYLGFPAYTLVCDGHEFYYRQIEPPNPALAKTLDISELLKSASIRTTFSEANDVQTDLHTSDDANTLSHSDEDHSISSASIENNTNCPTEQKPSHATHYIAFNLNDPEFLNKVQQFQQLVLNRGYIKFPNQEQLFQHPDRLHMTICLLTIDSPDMLSRVKTYFDSFKTTLLESIQPIRIQLYGIDTLLEDVQHTRLIVTKPRHIPNDSSIQTLRQLEATFIQGMLDQGILSYENLLSQRLCESDLKTIYINHHITLMNTKFLKDPKAKQTFDARYLIEQLRLTSFGVVHLKEIQLIDRQRRERICTIRLP